MRFNQIEESFRRNFEVFFEQKNIFWHNGVFAGRSNEFFNYSFVFSENSEGEEEFNIIFLVIPEFCVRKSKLETERRYGLSIKDLVLLEKLDVSATISDGTDVDEVMSKYLQIAEKYYDKYFSFDSITEYAEKMLDTGMRMLDYTMISPLYTHKMYPKLAEIDFVDICFYYLKKEGRERCKEFVMQLVSGYRTVLYDQMKYDNMSGLSEIIPEEELRKFDKMFINYSNVSNFLESLLADNDSYFLAVDEKFRQSRIEAEKIIEEVVNNT